MSLDHIMRPCLTEHINAREESKARLKRADEESKNRRSSTTSMWSSRRLNHDRGESHCRHGIIVLVYRRSERSGFFEVLHEVLDIVQVPA